MTPAILIGTPCKGSVCANFFLSVIETGKELSSAGVTWGIIVSEDGDIDASRNEIVFQFLQDPNLTHLLFWDSDVGVPPGALLSMVDKNVPVICGVYPKRILPIEFPCSILDTPVNQEGLHVAIGAPAGFLLIQRWVLEKLVVKFAHRKYTSKESPRIAVFEHEITDGRRYSEDINFCRRCHGALGILIHVESSIEFTHQGEHQFKGKLSDVLNPPPLLTIK